MAGGPLNMPPTITFTSKKPNVSLTVALGGDPPVITGGYGGWEKQARPMLQALTRWTGRDPLEQSISILFDKFRDLATVEDDIQKLEQMAFPLRPGLHPPIIRISNEESSDGAGLHTENKWVIANITWGASTRTRKGFRTRQEAVVDLLHFIGDDYVKPLPPAKNRNKKGGKQRKSQSALSVPFHSSPILYVVKEGDTLTSIAARELGDWNLWTDLADINGLRDPDNISMGQHLRMIDHNA